VTTSRKAAAVWNGTGGLNTANKFFTDTPYSFKTRFANEAGVPGTNPEELIAAAHAGCFAMADYPLSKALSAVPIHLEATSAA